MKNLSFNELNQSELSKLFGGQMMEDTSTTLTDSKGGKHCDVKDENGCVTIVEC
ncbi:hypothetical protein [Tenacibaculum sp.]|uniref:hypothetical protein n=1 Tax=Tenacibaculum sp. TaxID=1906242 RepID=UPI003AA84A86